jgi:hypothetical protein
MLRGTRANLLLFACATPKTTTVSTPRAIKQAVVPFESNLGVHYVSHRKEKHTPPALAMRV